MLANQTGNEMFNSNSKYLRDVILVIVILIEISALAANTVFISQSCCVPKRQKKTRTVIYMTFVCITHLGVALFVVPFKLISLSARQWILGDEMCYVNSLMIMFWFSLNVYSMTILSFHKYFHIVYPMYRPHTRRTMAGLILLSIVISCVISATTVVHSGAAYEDDVWLCTIFADTHTRNYVTVSIVMFFCFVLPVVLNTFAYQRTINALSKHMSRIKSTTLDYETAIKSQKHVACTLFIAFVLYIFCWTPFFISWILLIVQPGSMVTRHLRRTAFTVGLLSISINPVIYLIRKNTLWKKFGIMLRKTSLLKKNSANDNWPSSPNFLRLTQFHNVFNRRDENVEVVRSLRQSVF